MLVELVAEKCWCLELQMIVLLELVDLLVVQSRSRSKLLRGIRCLCGERVGKIRLMCLACLGTNVEVVAEEGRP